jgi:hypothetical protein
VRATSLLLLLGTSVCQASYNHAGVVHVVSVSVLESIHVVFPNAPGPAANWRVLCAEASPPCISVHCNAVSGPTLQLKADHVDIRECFAFLCYRNYAVLLVLIAINCSVEACVCSNNVQPCPPGCAAGQCIMRPAICTCTTGCSHGGCDSNYIVSLVV